MHRPIATLAALALPVVPAAAQDAPDIVVTGRGLDERAGDRALAVVTIGPDRIAASAADRLEALLADVAGVQQFRRSDSRSANPTSQGISLRGIGGNAAGRALLLLDGVPQADPFGGWIAFPAFATGRLAQIRVTRGGGSGYQGPGALAGTIELDSALPDGDGRIAARASGGGRGAVDAQGSAALVRGGGSATLSAAVARGDGFTPVVAEDRGPADRRAPYRQASVAARAVIALGAATEVQANVAAFADDRTRGTAFTANRSRGADASLRVVGRGAWRYQLLAYLQARDFASQFAAVDAARTAASPTLDQFATPAIGIGGRIELAPPIGSGRDLRIGADLRALDGRTQELFAFVAGAPTRRRDAGGRTRTIGLFADGSMALGPVTATLGGRLDRWLIADGRLTERALAGGAPAITLFPDRAGTEATGRAGIAWQMAAPVTLRAAAYRGWRLPTLNELYRPFRVGADATAANAALAPERLTGIDLGATIAPAPGVSIAATLFANRLDDAIANVTIARGPGQFSGVGFVSAAGAYRVRGNLDAIVSRGIEVDARYSRRPLFAHGSWSLVDPRVRASGIAAPFDGLRPAQTPRSSVSATLGWRADGAEASATVRHVSRAFEDDANARALAAATTIDAVAILPLAGALSLELRGENVLGERVEAAVSGTGVVERAAPRTFWLGVRLRG